MFAAPIESACTPENVKPCIASGQMAEQSGDTEKAKSLFSKACESNSGEGCLYAAGLYLNEENVEQASQLLSKGCELKEPAACYGLGVANSGVFGGNPNYPAAIEAFDASCALGLVEGCGSGAMLTLDHGDDSQREAALKRARDACAQKDASTCFALGQRESEAGRVEVGVNFYRNACQLGDGVGCRALAFAHVDGRGAQKDAVMAESAFERGCVAELQDLTSCAFYGYSRYQNADTDEKRETAKAILKDTCAKKDAEACFRMALVEPGNASWVQTACEIAPDSCDRFMKATTPLSK